MSKLTKYEKNVLMELKTDLKFYEKILLKIFENYTYKIYQKGFRDKYFKK
jgi:hypothetical protein